MTIIVKTCDGDIDIHPGACRAKRDSEGVLTIERNSESGESRIKIAQYAPNRWNSWVEKESGATEPPVKQVA